MKKLGLFALIFIFLFCGTNAFANSMGFEDIVVGEFDLSDNFSLDVSTSAGNKSVTFTLSNSGSTDNNGPTDFFIGGVFWDFGDIDSLVVGPDNPVVVSSSDINFSWKKNQDAKNLPQGNELPEPFSTSYSAFAKNGNTGIDPGESATFTFYFTDDDDFAEVVAGLDSGAVRTAIHVQGVEGYDEDSDTYIARVSEPATMLLLGLGLIGIAGLGRKKLFKKK